MAIQAPHVSNPSCSCERLSAIQTAVLLIQQTFVELTLALRVFAMYGFSGRVFASLAAAAVVTITLGAWSTVGFETTMDIDLPGCHVATVNAQAIRMAAAWEAQLVCDILILGLTLRRAYTYHLTIGLGSGSVLSVMVRDGAVYFGLMICLVNVANITMLYVGDILTAGSLAWFASAVSVTMISRLMLNLHDAAQGNSSPQSFAGPETLQFRRPEEI
ncbi:hypothetical protein B0H13DRAFT_2318526 [Mycena leptocephala]|nr:hypothetical protein B0H13DRAFT_2318526 [Mycena leptocephala]